MAGPGGSAEVVSIAAAAVSRVGYKRFASGQVATARRKLGMTLAEFADYLAGEVGYPVAAETVRYWEEADSPPSEVYLAAEAASGGTPGTAASLLNAVPASFPASVLAGHWVTCYQFTHAGKPMTHADVATVTAEGDRLVRAVNHPPDPRTQGRAVPFRNQIEAELVSRHLIGTWRNTSDSRYFGSLHLAVLPGETVMEGHYTGFASDVEVSAGRWKWVRLDAGEGALDGLVLRGPDRLYEAVASRSPSDVPLTADEIREDT